MISLRGYFSVHLILSRSLQTISQMICNSEQQVEYRTDTWISPIPVGHNEDRFPLHGLAAARVIYECGTLPVVKPGKSMFDVNAEGRCRYKFDLGYPLTNMLRFLGAASFGFEHTLTVIRF
jgi:hypothetical protein